MLNPDIYRRAAGRLLANSVRERVFCRDKMCCPAISDVCNIAGISRDDCRAHKDFFAEWFMPSEMDDPMFCPWWELDELMPRLIALDLMVLISEDNNAAMQEMIEAIDAELLEILGEFLGKANVTSMTLIAIERQVTQAFLGLGQPPKWLRFMRSPHAVDQIVPANLPTALALAGYARTMDPLELAALDIFKATTHTTPDGSRWTYTPEAGASVVLPVPVQHINITLNEQN